MASCAAASAKVILDTTHAGYYSQAYRLVWHMAETSEQMVYLLLNERTTNQWPSPDDMKPAGEPERKSKTGTRRFPFGRF
jgi:hypothetical protein